MGINGLNWAGGGLWGIGRKELIGDVVGINRVSWTHCRCCGEWLAGIGIDGEQCRD